MEDVVCLFHADCFDGLGAAWAVSKRFPDAKYLPVDYRNPPPEGLEGKHVVIVDFSYGIETMREIIAVAKYVTFLDHHERSKDICATLSLEGHRNLSCTFDQYRSGATLAWYHFHPRKRCPMILHHIEDRDLWSWVLNGTNEIMLGMGIYPLKLSAWQSVLNAVDHDDTLQEHEFLLRLQTNGDVIKIKNQTDIDRIIDQTIRYIDFAGFTKIPMINVPRSLGSEALQQLANDHEFAVGYYDDETHRVVSLRSRKGGQVVHTLAEQFGGGGHAHSAAFTVPRDHEFARM